MQKETSAYTEEIKKYFRRYFLPLYIDYINTQIKFVKDFNELTESYKRTYKSKSEHDAKFINNLKLSYHKSSNELISLKYNKPYKQNWDGDLAEFAREINTYFSTIDENIIRAQDDERFLVSDKDSIKIKFYKRIKSFFYSLSQLPIKFSNLFRRLFRKTLKEEKLWYHKVPFRNLTIFYLRDTISLNFIPHLEEINKKISAALLEAWRVDEELSNIPVIEKIEFKSDVKKEIEELERLPADLSESFERIFNQTIILYEDAYRKSGTVELPSNKFSPKKIENKHEELNEEYESSYNGWANTFYSLFEDWRLNKELYTLSEKLRNDFNELTVKTNEKFNKNISPYLKKIKEFLVEAVYRFKGFSGSSSEVKSFLYREKNSIHNKLSEKVIPEATDIILTQNIPDLIDQMEYSISNGVDSLSEKRAIVKTTSYKERIKDSEIDYISPNEIITYSSLLAYIKSSTGIKSDIMQNLNEIQKELRDVDQIADFNLESALSMFNSDTSAFEDPLDIAIEGINRAIAKEEAVGKKLNDIKSKINEELYNAVEKINDELISLTKSENIFEIKLKIARTKTLQRTEELKQTSINFIKNFFPILIKRIKRGFITVSNYYLEIKQKIGLAPRPVSISTEISDFLAATEIAVSKLPFVYQRLFGIEPLEDERFFEGRDEELSFLRTAYKNWNLKKYAPVVIVGEKGSGITTLLNFYFRQLDTNYNIIRTKIDKVIYNEKEFIDFLKNLFKNGTFNNIDDTVTYLNNLVTRQIVVIENMQNLFLKKVNGFDCLKMLFELISKTNQNVFWIISSTLYAWEYLSKAMNVTDYFGYKVVLQPLSDEQMIDIIIKRHRISGYNIYFETSGRAFRKYKKYSETEVQEQLKKEYFSELNEFAKSNISLALLYWMRSTKEVTANTIKQGSAVELDFEFLKAMNPEKFFILYILILHDGLTEEAVAEIYNLPLKEIRLSLLVLIDDGIILRRGDLYIINPLLYRQIVYLLQSKNIIH